MRRKSEGKFQDKCLETWRASGLCVQKFNDLFSEGIPDTFIKPPTEVPYGVNGAWIELKSFDEWPKRDTSPMPKKAKPTEGQMRWMHAFATRTVPCWVLVNTPGGWLIFDHTEIEEAWTRPWTSFRAHLQTERPTLGRMLRGVYAR